MSRRFKEEEDNIKPQIAMHHVLFFSNTVMALLDLQGKLLKKDDAAFEIAKKFLRTNYCENIESDLNKFVEHIYGLAIKVGGKVLDRQEGDHWKIKEVMYKKKKFDKMRQGILAKTMKTSIRETRIRKKFQRRLDSFGYLYATNPF